MKALVLLAALAVSASAAETPRKATLAGESPSPLSHQNVAKSGVRVGPAELHAHLFMKEGMSWMFSGGFDEPLQTTSWRDRFKSSANPETLNASGLSLVVETLYAHPLLVWNMRDSIRRQIALAEKFVATPAPGRKDSGWILARSAGEARQALGSGKRVMLLALEGASGIIENDADIEEFIVRGGISIVTPLHLTDDHLGGVAFLRGFRALSSPIAWLVQLLSPAYDPNGVRVNKNALSESGRQLIEKLIARKVWIDLAHSSDAAQREIVPMLKRAGQPLLYTHTSLRRHLRAERAISDEQLKAVQASRGYIGLMPALDMLEDTPSPCGAGFRQLVTQYREAASALGAESVAFGSDFNGGVEHLPPDCAEPRALADGFWRIDQSTELWAALARAGAPVPREGGGVALGRMTERFVETWARVRP